MLEYLQNVSMYESVHTHSDISVETMRTAWRVRPPVVDCGITSAGTHWLTAVELEYAPPIVTRIANRWTAAYSTR